MHPTALKNCEQFFACYADEIIKEAQDVLVVDVGSQDVNGSLRTCCPKDFDYVGVDFVAGKGVDIVIEDPYVLPFESESADVVLSSSCFEHSEMFWLSYLEILRILKPHGLFYMSAPSNGDFHRYPVDCWRFYPDSGRALVTWAKRNGMKPAMLESYTSLQYGDQWNDFIAVFLKDEDLAPRFPRRVLHFKKDFTNGLIHGKNEFLKEMGMPEDRKKILQVKMIIDDTIKLL